MTKAKKYVRLGNVNMYNELSVMIGSREHRVYLQNGFYKSSPSNNLHNHNYTEIHMVSGGKILFTVGNERYSASSGDVIIVPPKVYHCCSAEDDNVSHSAFQISHDTDKPALYNIDPGIMSSFFKEIARAEESGDHTVVSAYITLIFSHFDNAPKEIPHTAIDYGFFIHEFFTLNYNKDIRLADLAAQLFLSERQTERLVIEYTGKTFREKLTEVRMDMAKLLLSTSDMSLGEVAAYVGYRSYAGFWKAMKKYE